jgi:hypothetical protein
MRRYGYTPGEVRSESSASERCILSPEERPLSLVVDTTRDNRTVSSAHASETESRIHTSFFLSTQSLSLIFFFFMLDLALALSLLLSNFA